MMATIQIGIDDSHVLRSLLARQQASEIDFVKLDGGSHPDALNAVLAYKPAMIHDISQDFWLNYENPFQEAVMSNTRRLLDAAKPPWFSTGIGASAEPQGHTLPFWRGAEASALQTREKVAENIVRNGRRLKDWLGATPLLLENYNYHPTNAYEYVCEPEFFGALIDAIDCGMLLDLAHAQISAHNMGWDDPIRYLEALPLDRVGEIHVSHPELLNGQMLDMHHPIEQSDAELLRWALAHTPARMVSLEVNENIDEAILLAQVELLRSVVIR
jgi:uncharacterized protein (UPF0276 family)